MLIIECEGSPYEIGKQHGKSAKAEVNRSISFYAGLFSIKSNQSWSQVRGTASTFEKHIHSTWPAYHEEMQGIADGAGVDLLDIVALNVRTEIAFGQFSDGCTSLAWHTGERAFLGQNWDWMEDQKQNLIVTKIIQDSKPTICQITEAGIIGKIGFNSCGVGTLLNAIQVKGVDASHLPVHLGLRMVLDSSSTIEAVEKLEKHGMASSAHILIADPDTAIGLEFSASTFARCMPDALGRVVHTNHLLHPHPFVVDTVWLKDSLFRADRMTELSGNLSEANPGLTWENVSQLFEDEKNYPTSICRAEEDNCGTGTLFNILMDLKTKSAIIRKGRPTQTEELISLAL
ncbi:putative acyl-CoA:6-aminopenicillanic-acid-acyltransferase [Delitschia confertaspora ATCC 74209]|uniref:Acyl-CoA:6-aminopenicillanic-acid-acyltransferase n=1 Tax=Delitschia confertaspora ATCC 74209 TaxID=1513339 RepID=A0A9P4MRX6_9PLEO|nr:putative acyl-CoA:6-aminopenicillanic-acid-acyltransferase [Delitschia confertaspora ATCC 74209]